jgi:tetratricopeptide (TPR) repeat protein
LGEFWIKRGSLSEGRAWLERSLAAAGWRAADPPRSHEGPPLARALASLGTILFRQGEYPAAVALLTVAVAPLEQLALRREAALARQFLIAALAIQGDVTAAQRVTTASLPLLLTNDDPSVRALVGLQRGLTAMHSGDDRLAQHELEQACATTRVTGDLSRLATYLLHLGTIELRLGNQEGALACFSEASELALKDRGLQGQARNNLGELARVRGDYTAAAEQYTASLRLLEDTDRRSDIPRLLHSLGYVALRRGATDTAYEHFRLSLELFHRSDPRGVTEVLDGLAAAAATRGEPLLAARWWGAAAAARDRMRLVAWLPDQLERTHYEALAHSACDPDAFAAAWAADQTLTVEQAVAEARPLTPP